LKNLFLLIFALLLPFSVHSEQDERLEILYEKIEQLKKEINELRNLLEENTILLDRALELQQQRYLDLDNRVLEISKISSLNTAKFNEEDIIQLPEQEKELFRTALILFEESRYAEALDIFSEVIISFPNGTFAPDAYFWSGELFLAQKMYEDAKLSFNSVIEQFPKHQRTPDSLFKLGEIYRLEGELEDSIIIYDRVQTSFPDSGAAQLAKKSRESLKEQSNLVE
jgi:tol-pal system protein YbgF